MVQAQLGIVPGVQPFGEVHDVAGHVERIAEQRFLFSSRQHDGCVKIVVVSGVFGFDIEDGSIVPPD